MLRHTCGRSRGEEALTVAIKAVPRTDHGALKLHFTTCMANFVEPYLLRQWNDACLASGDESLRSTAADNYLLDVAALSGVPLITNEGSGVAGIKALKLRKKAINRGVPVFTPGEFIKGKIDEDAAIGRFLEDFDRAAPTYIETLPRERRMIMKDSLDGVEATFRHILRGETSMGIRVPMKPGYTIFA
jgi:hypothetical protein